MFRLHYSNAYNIYTYAPIIIHVLRPIDVSSVYVYVNQIKRAGGHCCFGVYNIMVIIIIIMMILV